MLIFDLAGLRCAVDASEVRQIVPMALLSHPPGLPYLLQGFLNLRGETVPVLRLDRLFGLPEQEPGLYTPLVLLRREGGTMALMADRVIDMRSLPADSFSPVAEHYSFNGCAEAEVRVPEGVIHVLSPRRILVEQERQSLAHFQHMAEERLKGTGELAP